MPSCGKAYLFYTSLVIRILTFVAAFPETVRVSNAYVPFDALKGPLKWTLSYDLVEVIAVPVNVHGDGHEYPSLVLVALNQQLATAVGEVVLHPNFGTTTSFVNVDTDMDAVYCESPNEVLMVTPFYF